MVGVLHRNNPRALSGENFRQHLVRMLKLRPQLSQKLIVVFRQSGGGFDAFGRGFDFPRQIKNQPLPPQTAFGHQPPIPFKAFVARTAGPDVGRLLGFRLIPQQFVPIIRIAIVLDLQPLLFGEGLHQQRKLVLKFIQLRHLRVHHVGRLKDESL
jgi:hypothetical protein